MNAAKIVIGEVQRDSSFQVRQLLAERIGEPRKPAKLHPHREVLPFHVASRNVALAGVSDSHLGYNLDDWAWGVPLSSMLPIVPVQLHKLGKVHVQSEGFLDGIPVKVETIRGQLDLVGQTIMQIADKLPRVFHGPLADDVGRDQFGVCVHRNENPLISDLVQIVAIAYLALLLGHKRPDFVALYVAAIQVAQLLIQQLLASLANGFEQAHDGVSIQARESFRTANRAPLDKTLNRTRCRVRVRGHRIPRQFRVGFAESGFAGSAAPALNAALTEIAKPLAGLVFASDAGHGVSPLAFCGETSQNTLWSEAWVTPRFGLAPTPVSAEAGALICYSVIRWGARHRFLPAFLKRPASLARGVSHLLPKSATAFNDVFPCRALALVFHGTLYGRNPLVTSEKASRILDRSNLSLFLKALESVVNGNQLLFVLREIESPRHKFIAYRGNRNKVSSFSQPKNLPNRICEVKPERRRRHLFARIVALFFVRTNELSTDHNFHVRGQAVTYLLRNGCQTVKYALPIDDLLVDSLAFINKLIQLSFSLYEGFLYRVCHGGIMPKTGKSVNKNITTKRGKSGWDLALERAASHLYKNKLQAKRLRAAIALFREKIANGEPWPEGQSMGHNSGQQH